MGNVDTFHGLKRLVEMIGPPTLKVSTCSTLGIKLAPILATPSVVWSTSHNPWDVWNTSSIRPNKSRHGKLQPTWRQCGECDAWCCLRIKNWSSLRLNFEDQKTTPCYTGSFPSNWKVQGFCWGKVMARLHINLCEAQVSTHQMAELPLFLSQNFLRWEWSPWGLKSGARHIAGWDSWDSRGMFTHVYTISIWWVMQYLHLSKNVGDSWTTPPKHGKRQAEEPQRGCWRRCLHGPRAERCSTTTEGDDTGAERPQHGRARTVGQLVGSFATRRWGERPTNPWKMWFKFQVANKLVFTTIPYGLIGTSWKVLVFFFFLGGG